MKNHLTGKNVFIRTVTFHFTGHVEKVTKSWIVLSKAAWVADSGRFADAMKKGTLNEVEPYPDDATVRVSRASIIDVSDWGHDLPRAQK
jgi:hypothetical protein